jgi:hypothetical protein
MELSYENMKEFIENYFNYFNKYSQNFDPCQKMGKFWADDFKLTAYLHRKDRSSPIKLTSGKEFRNMLAKVHQLVSESLTLRDIVIDRKKKKVAVLLHSQKKVRTTGEQHEFTGIGIYQLCLDKDDEIKFKSLDLCVDNPKNLTSLWAY